MHLIVEGKGKLKEKEVYEAIEIMMKIMNAHRLLKRMDIKVRFKKMRVHAQCEEIEPRVFEIDISNTLNKLDSLLALAHELVHVKQFARKELNMKGPKIVYRGNVYDPKRIHYYDMPHEIEAHGRELGLVERYSEEKRRRLRIEKKLKKSMT